MAVRFAAWKLWHAVRYYWPRAKARKRVLARYRADVERYGWDWPTFRRECLTRKPWWMP